MKRLALIFGLIGSLALPASASTGTGLATPADGRSRVAASAHIYWSISENDRGGVNTIGRANPDGTAVQKSFIANTGDLPGAVAVAAGHIYWIEREAGTIARANLDGSRVNSNFIFAREIADGLAIGAGHIYWTAANPESGSAKISRANLDGSGINRNFISMGRGSSFGGLALNRRFIYWTNEAKGTIGRADLSGGHVMQRFIAGTNRPGSLALDAQYLYWARGPTRGSPGGTIARANLRGTGVNQSFISGTNAGSVAVDSRYLYWVNNSGEPGTIGRALLRGGEVNQAFITAGVTGREEFGAGTEEVGVGASPFGLAVGP